MTHLPQIAAMADSHFAVEKGERNGRTFTHVSRLEQRQRQEELARLTSGTTVTASALESAGELLREASEFKRVLAAGHT